MELEQVGRVFGAGEAAVHALSDATLRVHRGDYVSIMGPSGSGKSTLLNRHQVPTVSTALMCRASRRAGAQDFEPTASASSFRLFICSLIET